MSIARRLANDLFTYFKLDADIVHETEILEARCDDAHARTGTGNIVVIGSPGGQYIRRCLAKRRSAFTIAESESGLPVLQLKGETLSGPSQGNLLQGKGGLVYIADLFCRNYVHTSTQIFTFLHDALHNRARPIRLGTSRPSLPSTHRDGPSRLAGYRKTGRQTRRSWDRESGVFEFLSNL